MMLQLAYVWAASLYPVASEKEGKSHQMKGIVWGNLLLTSLTAPQRSPSEQRLWIANSFILKIDISLVNSKRGMMSCQSCWLKYSRMPGKYRHRFRRTSHVHQHQLALIKQSRILIKKWYSYWIKTALNQDKKIIGLQLRSWNIRDISSPRHGFGSLLTQVNCTILLTVFSRSSALSGTSI